MGGDLVYLLIVLYDAHKSESYINELLILRIK